MFYLYSFNGHGDVTQLTDATGSVIKNYEYDKFGNEINPDPNDTNMFRYCGEYFDKETGSYYLRARYYDPGIGRFTTEDSVRGKDKDPLSLNLYTYCHNDPMNFLDPSGHEEGKLVDFVKQYKGKISWNYDTITYITAAKLDDSGKVISKDTATVNRWYTQVTINDNTIKFYWDEQKMDKDDCIVLDRAAFLKNVGMDSESYSGEFKVTKIEKGIRFVAVAGEIVFGGGEVKLAGVALRVFTKGYKYKDWLLEDTGTYKIEVIKTTMDYGWYRGGKSEYVTEVITGPDGKTEIKSYRNDAFLVQ